MQKIATALVSSIVLIVFVFYLSINVLNFLFGFAGGLVSDLALQNSNQDIFWNLLAVLNFIISGMIALGSGFAIFSLV